MKKIILLILLYLSISLTNHLIKVKATDDYNTYSEIMMNEGKLLVNFLDEEIELYLQFIEGSNPMFGVKVFEVNKNIEATYISNTLYSVENLGDTDVVYDIEVVVETNNKVSFSASGSLNGAISSSKDKLKGEIGGKCGIEYSEITAESRKEKQKLQLVVEANSRAIVYLTGSMSITNGVAQNYFFFVKTSEGGFEIVTLKNQYARIEKVAIE